MHDGQIEITLREDRGAIHVAAHGGTRAILDGPEEAWESCQELLALHGEPPGEDGNTRVALRFTARGRFCVTPLVVGADPTVCRDGSELWSALLHCARHGKRATALARVEPRRVTGDRGHSRRAEPVEIVIDDETPEPEHETSRGGLFAGLIGDIVGSRYGGNAGQLAQRAAQRVARNVNDRRNAVPAPRKSARQSTPAPKRHGGPAGPRRMVKPKCDPILGTVDWGALQRER